MSGRFNVTIGINIVMNLYAGVEYILSDRLFESLPQEEQKLWHSHAHEVCTL